MDFAVSKWLDSLRVELSQLPGFDKEGIYYKMPVSGLYVVGTTKLNRYLALTKEKRTGNLSLLRTFIIFLEYIYLSFRFIFGLKNNTIIAFQSDNYFALFFGNHRVRVCSVTMQEDIIVDLTQPKPQFNINSYLVGKSGFSNWAPQMRIIDVKGRIVKEQRLRGIAINRIKTDKLGLQEKNFIFEYKKAQLMEEKEIPLSNYIQNIECRLFECKADLQEIIDSDSRNIKFNYLFDSIAAAKIKLKNSGLSVVKTCPSHRDLNRGNVLFESSQSELKIIDWEFFSDAVVDYDIFVFVSNVRHNQKFSESYSYFAKWARLNDFKTYQFSMLLFLLEELRFLLDNLSVRKEKRKLDFQVIEDVARCLHSLTI